MDSELKKFEARFGHSLIKTLTGNEIKEWLAGLPLAPKTRMKIFGYIRNAYGIAVQKGLLDTHPFEKVENFIRNKKSEAPAFPLTPEEAQRLLNAAEPSVLPFIAVGMFAGLRTSERDLLEWKHFILDDSEPYLDVPKAISKTGERRLIPLQPALLAFLAPFMKTEGRIIPLTCNGNVAYQNAWERSVKAAGHGRVGRSFTGFLLFLSLSRDRLCRNYRRRRWALGPGHGRSVPETRFTRLRSQVLGHPPGSPGHQRHPDRTSGLN